MGVILITNCCYTTYVTFEYNIKRKFFLGANSCHYTSFLFFVGLEPFQYQSGASCRENLGLLGWIIPRMMMHKYFCFSPLLLMTALYTIHLFPGILGLYHEDCASSYLLFHHQILPFPSKIKPDEDMKKLYQTQRCHLRQGTSRL